MKTEDGNGEGWLSAQGSAEEKQKLETLSYNSIFRPHSSYFRFSNTENGNGEGWLRAKDSVKSRK